MYYHFFNFFPAYIGCENTCILLHLKSLRRWILMSSHLFLLLPETRCCWWCIVCFHYIWIWISRIGYSLILNRYNDNYIMIENMPFYKVSALKSRGQKIFFSWKNTLYSWFVHKNVVSKGLFSVLFHH